MGHVEDRWAAIPFMSAAARHEARHCDVSQDVIAAQISTSRSIAHLGMCKG